MRGSRLLAIPFLLALAACDSGPAYKAQAWEKVKADLKAPSTAKLVKFEAMEVVESMRKEFFLRGIYEIQWGFRSRETLKSKGWVMNFTLKVLMEHMTNADAAELLDGLKQAAPSQAKDLEELTTQDKLNLKGSFTPSKKELPKALEVLEASIKKAADRELARYEQIKNTLESKWIFLEYDAQNSFGAMLRGHAQFYWQAGTLLDPEEPFDRVLVGLPKDHFS